MNTPDTLPHYRWEMESVRLCDVLIATEYQRDLRPDKVREIVKTFDPILMDPPVISYRENGRPYCVDGQHRVHALKEILGENGEWRCRVYRNLTLAEEARIFGSQDDRLETTPLQRYHAGLIAGRSPYVEIAEIVEATGWSIAKHMGGSRQGQIESVGELVRIYKQRRKSVLEKTLQLLQDGIGDGSHAPNQAILAGTSQFITWYDGEYEYEHMVSKLRSVGYEWLVTEGDKRRLLDRIDSRSAIGMVLVNLYNRSRRASKRLMAWETALIRESSHARRAEATESQPVRLGTLRKKRKESA